MSWDESGILIGQGSRGIMRVPPTGGSPETLINVKTAEVAHGPQMLPDGKTVLFTGRRNSYPVWSSDGQRVAFQSDREGDLGIFWQRADGTGQAERLTKPDPGVAHIPESWSRRGD